MDSFGNGLFLGIMLGGMCVFGCCEMERKTDQAVYERAIQYTFGKTPEEVKVIIQDERKREGR